MPPQRVQGRGRVDRRDLREPAEGADEALIVIDAATSFRAFDDIGGDPADVLPPEHAGIAGHQPRQQAEQHAGGEVAVAEHARVEERARAAVPDFRVTDDNRAVVEEICARLEGLHDLIRSVRDCPKPVIAAVEGAAAGAGLSLAMACDMLVAAQDAMFTVAYVKVGLTPDGGATAFLAEFVSRQVLTELCLTGAPLSGERMHALGAVNRLVASGCAQEAAMALAADISKGPPHAMGRIKHLCRLAMRHSLNDQLELEAQFMVEAMASDESLEGINAFLNKRPPNYTSLRKVNA